MTTERNVPERGSKERLLRVSFAHTGEESSTLHPGWVHATAILLRGLKRLEDAELSTND